MEGFSRTVYFCPAGYPTIGYGHVVKDDEDFSAGIDEAQAEVPEQLAYAVLRFMRWIWAGVVASSRGWFNADMPKNPYTNLKTLRLFYNGALKLITLERWYA